MRSKTLALWALSAGLAATAGEYFPLQVGNQWVYAGGGTRQTAPLVLGVTEFRQFGNHAWFLFEGLRGGPYWLRNEGAKVLRLDEKTFQEELWYDFEAPGNKPYETAVPGGMGIGVILSREAEVTTPAGTFWGAIDVQYPRVFQVGIDREYFVDGVGMVARIENTGGPSVATYDLIYARTGTATAIRAPQLSVRASVSGGVLARLTLENTTPDPVTLHFPFLQTHELVVRDSSGFIVWRWTEGRLIAANYVRSFGPGEYHFFAPVPCLRPGNYALEMGMLNSGPAQYAASTLLRVPEPAAVELPGVPKPGCPSYPISPPPANQMRQSNASIDTLTRGI